MSTPSPDLSPLVSDVINAFDKVNGYHAGFRPAHAKGVLLSGTFTPAAGVASLTRAPHLQRESLPVTVRFSDFAGIPTIADNDPNGAGPRGIAIRFHLADHVHTDLIAHSTDGFPVRTAEEFVGFLGAVAATQPGLPEPTPIQMFLGANPAALKFVLIPKPIPSSFARELFFGVNAYKFINAEGFEQFGRFRVVPAAGHDPLTAEAAAAKGPNFLFEELTERIAAGPVELKIVVQLAAPGDVVDDSTIHWGERPEAEFGTVTLSAILPADDHESQKIIFDPIPRVEGIEPSADPLLEPRAAVYLATGRRRRAAATAAAAGS